MKPTSCKGCIGEQWGPFIPPTGPASASLCLVGEVPGEGESRKLLNFLLKRAGITEDQYHYLTLVSCRPPKGELNGTWYGDEALQHCRANLLANLRSLPPSTTVVALGDLALQALVGESGMWRWRGRVVKGVHGGWVVPTFHPGFFLPHRAGGEKNPHRYIGAFLLDILKAQEIATTGFARAERFNLLDPPLDVWEQWVEECLSRPERPLAWDIETPYKDDEDNEEECSSRVEGIPSIIRIGFGHTQYHAVSVPCAPPYLDGIRALLAAPMPKCGWNSDDFDVIQTRKANFTLNGEQRDYMKAFKLWQSDLRRGLEQASSYFSDLLPWKHLSKASPAFYNATDIQATLDCMVGLNAALARTGQLDTFLNRTVKVFAALRQAGDNGVLVDTVKLAGLKREMLARRAELIPAVLDSVPVEFWPLKHYKTTRALPTSTPCPACEGEDIPCTYCGDSRAIPAQLQVTPAVKWVKRCDICGTVGVTKSGHSKKACKGATFTDVEVESEEWDQVLPFNCNSTEQVKALVKSWGHPLGKPKRGQKTAGLDKTQLQKLTKRYGTKFPFYARIAELRKIEKAVSQYVEGLHLDEAGTAHSTYTDDPSTGRLASQEINFQNISKHASNPWAAKTRDCFVAPPGHLFVQGDSSSIEAVFTGYFMDDPAYMAMAKKGIHAAWCCQSLGIPFTLENAKLVKHAPEHAALYNRKKRTVHGTSYGLGAKLMVEMYPDLFPTERLAQAEIDDFYAFVPKLKEWHEKVRWQAHQEGKLVNPWGGRHYFYGVWWHSDGVLHKGPDANRAIAFLPQSSAGEFCKDTLIALSETWMWPYAQANISVHDGYTICVPEALVERAVEEMGIILARPIPQMGGLRVGAEIEVGPNWGKGMKAVKQFSGDDDV